MNAITPAFACWTGGMRFEDALSQVLSLATPLPTRPAVPEVGLVLAEPVAARLDLPGFEQSAMDGYAVRHAGLAPGIWLPITGRTAAGEPPSPLTSGGAHRILTGALLPDGADTVIVQEDTERDGDILRITALPAPGANIRHRGEDIRTGTDLIPVGTVLDWRHMTVLAAQGIGSISVRPRPRVALLSSGRELVAENAPLAAGQIHDSNRPMLAALLSAWGADVHCPPAIPDDAGAMQASLRAASEDADLVLTTAGISVGDEDHVRDALHAIGGGLAVLKVAMKPGKPLAAGRLGDTVFVGLPGNPQAALAGAVAFVRPLLNRMTGTAAPRPLHATATFNLRRKTGRAEFLPVRLAQSGACLRASRTGRDGSGRLSPLLEADGLAFLNADVECVGQDHILPVFPFAGGLSHA